MSSDKLAYFFEAHDLGHVFSDWPEEIGLVLCLDSAGLCEVLLFHVSERHLMAGKAAECLSCAHAELDVVPEAEGFPTRRVMFTDEQQLLGLIIDEDDLPELAQDYLINHQFDASRKAARPRAAAERPEEHAPGQASEVTLKSKTAGLADVFRWKPRLHLSDAPPKRRRQPELPEGFVALDAAAECHFVGATLEAVHNGLRLSLSPEKVAAQTPVRGSRPIGFRDNLSCFVLPNQAVAGWQPGASLVIDLPADSLPDAMRQRFGDGPRQAEVTVAEQGVFVTPGALAPDRVPEAEVPAPRRRIFRPVRSALIGLFCLGMLTGALLRDQAPDSLSFLSPLLFLPADAVQANLSAAPGQADNRIAAK